MSSDNETIQKLADAFQRGEERGFSYFFKSLYPPLLYYAFTIIGNKPAAEDIVEEAFIKIWDRRDNFNHSRVIKSWLYTTVRNACFDYLKQQKREGNYRQEFEIYSKLQTEQSALHSLISIEVIREIYNSIRKLPPQCQKVIELLYIQGKSLKETAEELNISINTVKNQRARGLKLIREKGSFSTDFPIAALIFLLAGL